MYSFLDRPLPSAPHVRRVISLSTVFARNSRPGRLLVGTACAALLVCAGAHKTQAQTTFNGGGAISITGTTVHSGNSSTLSVSGATGSVKTVFITLDGVDASGSGNNSGIGCSSFVLEGPGDQKFLLLGDTGADDTMSNATIVVEDGKGAAPLAGGDSNTDWSTTGGTVEPSSYWNGGFGWCGLIAVPSELSGVSLPQTDGSATLTNTFGSTDANGTWTLAIYTDDPDSGPDPISITGWSLTMTFNTGVSIDTTTSVSSNITNPGLTTSSYTYTATVTSSPSGTTVDAGTVDFTANGATISGCGAKAVSGGTATCNTTFSTQGLYPIVAMYSGGTDGGGNNFDASTSSTLNQLVEVTSTGSTTTNTWCNGGSLAVPGTTVPVAYPSVIKVSGYPAGTTVANVEVELNSATGFVDAQHLLVAPTNTFNLDFFDQGFDSAFSASGSIDLDFLDGGSSGYPDYPSGDDAPAAGSYLASDESGVSDTFSPSSAPTYDSSIPQVPGTVNYGYDPFTANPHGPITATFENNFNGAPANGAWALYPYQPLALTETIGGGWCIVLTLNSGVATTTTLTSSANPAVAQAPVTLTAAVKAGSSPVTNGGTVTFLENGTAPAGTTGGDNVVNLNTSTGQSSFTTPSGTSAVSTTVHTDDSGDTKTIYEGDYDMTADYSGVADEDDLSSGNLWQRFNSATTYSAGSGGSINACNSGPVLLDEDNNKGPFEPNPSNIFVSGMPGTVNAVTLSLNGFYTSNSGAINETESLIEGPTDAALDFFSNTGNSSTQLGTTTSPLGTLTFADPNNSVPDSGNYPAGTYKATSYGTSASTYTSSLSGFYNVPGTISYAQPHGSGTFASTFASTNPNGTWSLFFNTTGSVPAEGAQSGWCLNFTENPVAVTADENHSGAGTGGDFIQGETNAQITAAVSVNSASPSVSTGDPVGTNPLTVSDQLNSNLTYESFSGTGWSCSASGQTVTCTNDSAVASGSSYPTLTLNVNVSASAPASINNSFSVSGAGVTATTSNTDNITVDSSQIAPAITSGSSTTFTVGTTSSFTVTATGSPTPTFSETGALPSGVTFAINGTLSGTPAAGTGGTYAITITASNGVAPNATQNFTLTVDQAPAITSASSATFTVGTAGSFTATATGFPTPTFSETGALPSGVTFAINGTLSGTPAAGTGGTYAITITASNGVAPNATQNFTLTVDQAPAITSASSTTFTTGTLGSFTATATGFPTPTFSETGALPSGVTFAINGTLSGTPAAGTGGTYAITITASNGVAPNATQNFTLTVDQAPAITSASSTTFTTGTLGSFTATATGFPTPTFSETGALPSGVTFAINGTLSGTPAAGTGGTYAITITASNGVAPNATQNFTLTVDQAPAITSANNTAFIVGVPGTFTVTATGFPAAALSLSGTLPSGISFNDNGNGTGTLQGTAAAGTVGSYPVTITAMNGTGVNGQQSFTLTIDAVPSFVVTNTNDSGTGSLRGALSSAATAGAGSITFSPTAFSTAQTITLTTGTLTIPPYTSIAGPTSGTGATLTNLVTVAGGGSTSNFSVFTVSSGVAGAAIANLTITNGNSTIAGGGILNSGTLTVTGSTFSSDSASSGGGIRNSGTLTVTGSTFSGDSATNGGGIFNNTGTLTVTNSTFNSNSAPGGGGGGINNNGGTLTVTNSTFSGNSAAAGGGILNDGGGVLNVANSIVAGNSATGSFADIDASTYNNHGGNQAGTGSSGTSAIAIDLAPLGSYGGPTQTMIPQPGSPAICAGLQAEISNGVTADQRGEPNTNTTYPGYSAGSPCVDAGAVQTNYSIAFAQQPTNVLTIETISPSPTVQVSESGSPISQSGDSISLAATLGTLSGTTTEATGGSGLATFGGLSIATAETNDELTAALTLNSALTLAITQNSSQFNVELPVPTVTGVSPVTGPTTGGTTVTITGTNFTGATAVSFGGVPAASFTVNSPTQILAVSPVFASAATVDIIVTTTGGTSATSPADQFTYFVPIATSLTPTVTPGTTFVYANQPTISVAVSPSTATGTLTATLDTSTSLTVTPAGGGTFNIALPATPLAVGSHSIALAFTGTGVYESSTGSISLTVTAPSLVVNTATDDLTGTASNCTSLPEGTCTLRDALAAAGNAGGTNTINFASSAFPAPSGATIVLGSAGTLTIPSNTTVQGLTAGSGASLANLVTVDGASGSNGQFSVFTLNPGTTAAIANLTIAHGTGTSVSGIASGGGIYNNTGSLTVAGSTFFGNSATSGGGGGGAIFNSGTLTVTGSTFFGNSASTFGGGAILNDDNLTVTGSTFFGNSVVSTGDGGAINSAVFLTVANSTFSGNSPSSGNNGGAITNGGPSITVTNSIFANDTGGECDGSNCPTNGTSGNIVDSTGTHANLAPLGNYGGPTQTMIPLPGSAAICAGSSSLVPNGTTADQRGVAFNAGGYCPAGSVDAGAVETDYAMLFTTNPPATVIPNTNFTAGVTLTENGNPLTAGSASVGLELQGTGTLTNSGTSPVKLTASNGVASSSSLQVNSPGNPDALQASLTLTAAGASATATLAVLSQNFNAQVGQATHFSVSAPSTSNAGEGFHLTVTALDAGNNVVTGYTGTVHFTSTDPRAVPPSNSTLTNGSGTFTAVLETAGVQTITATDTSNSSITGTSNVVTVNPGPAESLVISAPSSAFVGGPFNFTVTALDGLGNVATSFTDPVVFTSSDGAAQLPGTSALTAGTGTFSATLMTTGNQTISATDEIQPSIAGTSGPIAVTIPGFIVNTTADDAAGVAANCTSTPEGTCTLRDALAAALAAGSGNITFDSTVFSAPAGATIALTSGNTLTIPSSTTITGATTGSGASLQNLVTVSGGGAGSGYSVFTMTAAKNAELDSLNITNGNGTEGGGIDVGDASQLTVNHCNVTGNTSPEGGGIYNLSTLTVENSTISGNTATGTLGLGGGIYSDSAATHLTVIDSTISGNQAAGSTGALGGGILSGSPATVTGSTIVGNSVSGGSDAANYQAGGILIGGTTGVLTLANSVVAGNASSGSYADISLYTSPGPTGTLTDAGGNLDGTASSGTSQVSPGLGALGNYGGPTQTMIPLPGSAAICAGSAANIPVGVATDQRGDGFNAGGYCPTGSVDAGAVETNYAISFTTEPSPISPANSIFANTGFQAAVTLDESGAPFTGAAVTIPLALTSNPPGATLSGGSASTSAGVASYSTLQVSASGTNDELTANLTLNSGVTPTVAISAASSQFNVGQLTPTLNFVPSPASQTYGTAITAGSLDSTATYNSANVAGTFAYTTTVNGNPVTLAAGTTVLPAGTYAITATFTPSDTTVYEGTSTTASYTVGQVALTITASSPTMSYGGTVPTITPSYSGFVNGDSATSLTTQPTCSTTATSHSAVGSYSSTCTGAVDANYAISYTPGSVTVASVALTITASSPTMSYGGTVPTITPSYSGFVNGDSATSLTTQPTCSTTATSHSAVGSYSSTCTGAVDANYAISYTAGSVTVNQAALNIAAANATKTYGTANPTFTGTVTGQQNGDTFTESFSTTAIVSSPVGAYQIVPSVVGANLSDYTQTIDDGTLTVTQAASITTVGLSSPSITPGQSETITVTVASSTTGTPTGSVSIYDGTTLLTTVPLTNGIATYTTSTLAPGLTHVIGAVYSGDGNFTGSTSSTTASVTVAPLDFTMTIAGPSSATVIPGQTVSYQVTVTPLYGTYAGTVNFAITGLPAGAVATFSPSSIAANGGPQTITVTIGAASASAANHAPAQPSPTRRAVPVALAFLLLFGLSAVRRRGRAMRRLFAIVLILAGGAAATLVSGCGGGFFAQAPQNYNCTITATAGNLEHSVNVTLNVQ